MKQLFISDLHLQEIDHPITQTFLSFLQTTAIDSDQLYILGDFFEYWIGDDHSNELNRLISQALSKLKDKGTEIFFMTGNRDFLLGEEYAKQCGMKILPDPYVLPAPQSHILLSHGDYLCVDDTEYQKIRPVLRSAEWQQDFLAKPLIDRINFAEQARQQSKENQQDYDLVDLNDTAIKEALSTHQCQLLIHGHTHQPGLREVTNSEFNRLTLSDWDHDIYYIEILDNAHPVLKRLTSPVCKSMN